MNKKILKIPNRWFYFSIVILLVYFLIRLIDISKIVFYFPIDRFANDYSGHMARLFFLGKYGFHNIVPNWFGGFPILQSYPPLYYFFSLPILKIVNSVQSATFISMILMFIIGFILIYIFCKLNKISKIKSLAFYVFFFANPIAIGYILRLGKVTEMFGWLWFFLLAIIVFWYKDHKLDKKFWLIIPILTLLFYSHILVFVVASLLVLSLLIARSELKYRIYVIISLIATIILTSYFWLPLISNINTVGLSSIVPLEWLINQGNTVDKIVAFILPLIFWGVFYLYWKSNGLTKREWRFYFIPLLISFLYLTRLAVFIPYLNRASPDTYHFFFIFLTIYLFLKLDIKKYSKKIKNTIRLLLIVLPILGIMISVAVTPFFIEPSKVAEETFSIFPYVEDKMIIIEAPSLHHGSLYSYAAIHHNLSTPDGWGNEEVSKEYNDRLNLLKRAFSENNCLEISSYLEEFKTKEVIAYDERCEELTKCGFSYKISKDQVCLLVRK